MSGNQINAFWDAFSLKGLPRFLAETVKPSIILIVFIKISIRKYTSNISYIVNKSANSVIASQLKFYNLP